MGGSGTAPSLLLFPAREATKAPGYLSGQGKSNPLAHVELFEPLRAAARLIAERATSCAPLPGSLKLAAIQ
jgi:hypothetical protein